MTIQMPQPGDVFLTYRIEKEIGKGGFSTVFAAIAPNGQRVAVKIITPNNHEPLYDRDLRDRVIREGQLLSQLKTPFTINIFGHGETANGLLYMVFEYITGDSLFDLIKKSGPQSPDRIISILRQILMGLQRAHELGILHRDIKPNNIMLFREGSNGDRAKVLDFGIAKRYDDASTDLTAAGLLVGTPRYMSPEQLRGGALDPRTDIYSLGLCVVELLTGKKAVWGKNKTAVIASQIDLNIPIKIPNGIAPLPFIAIVRKMVAKRASDRYVQATDVLRDIDLFLQGKAQHADGDTVFQTVDSAIFSSAPVTQPDTVHQIVRVEDMEDLERTVLTTVNSDALEFNSNRSRLDSSSHFPVDSEVFARTSSTPSQNVFSKELLDPPTTPRPSSPMEIPPGMAPANAVAVATAPKEKSTPTYAYFLNLILPGIGHVFSDHIPKGIVFFITFATAVGGGWFLASSFGGFFGFVFGVFFTLVSIATILIATADLFLTTRAQGVRPVKPLEFLPDLNGFLEKFKS